MATIIYSLAGEGRGHAARVRTIVNRLVPRCRVRILAPAVAYEFLSRCEWQGDVTVTRIPGLVFSYRDGRVSSRDTMLNAARYLKVLPKLVDRIRNIIQLEQPDLAITDFEPALPRAAEPAGLPYISIDHQHFLTTSNLAGVRLADRFWANVAAPLVSCYYRHQYETLVSSFYFPPVRRSDDNVTQIGVMLRRAIINGRKNALNDGPLLVYFRRGTSRQVLNEIAECGVPAHVYGTGEQGRTGQVTLCQTDDQRFVDDLIACRALLCNAGNQLVGEALYLGKPVLAIPEAGNFEQRINAHFLRQSGGGDTCKLVYLNAAKITQFLDAKPWQVTGGCERLNGTRTAIERIEFFLKLVDAIDPDESLHADFEAIPSHHVNVSPSSRLNGMHAADNTTRTTATKKQAPLKVDS